MSDDLKQLFEPEDYVVIVESQALSLRPELEDLVRSSTAFLVLRPEFEDGEASLPKASAKKAIASMHWQRLDIALGRQLGLHPMYDLADAHSQDLMHVAELMMDEDGEFLVDLDLSGFGEDLLYIDRIEVDEAFDVVEVGSELLEHVLRFHGGGCGAAVYYRDLVHSLGTSRLLLERGFRHLKEKGLFVIDLGLKRPRLGDEPVDQSDVEG
jgi:hypothetical protein